MNPPAHTVEEEHAGFREYAVVIREVADSVGDVLPAELVQRTGEVHDFMASRVIPHAVAEDQVLFPALRKESKTAQTVAMTQCHRQLSRFTDELGLLHDRLARTGPDRRLELDLRRVLYAMDAMLLAHLDEAEDAYSGSIAARLSPDEQAVLFDKLDGCARDVAELLQFGG